MSALVSSTGVHVETFASAESFLEQFDKHRAECLVTDFKMAGMSGLDLHNKLKSDGITMPTIIISAHVDQTIKDKALESGVLAVLEKPCRDYELLDTIREALGQNG